MESVSFDKETIYWILKYIFLLLGSSAVILKIAFAIKKKMNQTKYRLNIYEADDEVFGRKIKEILANKEEIQYVSLKCPQWDKILKSKNIALNDLKKGIERRNDNFRYILRLLAYDGSLTSMQMSGLYADEVIDVLRAYVKRILDIKVYEITDDNCCVEIWKKMKRQNGKMQMASCKFIIDISKRSKADMLTLKARMAEWSFFTHDELVNIIYPTVLLVEANCREFSEEDAPNLLFLKDYNIGLG